MTHCNHHGWIYLSGYETWRVHDSGRLRSITDNLQDPAKQYPDTILFVGSKSKNTALRQLFPNNNLRRGETNGFINIRLDNNTSDSDYPIVFMDTDPSAKFPTFLRPSHCHQLSSYTLSWDAFSGQDIVKIYARLAAPLSNVICIFADDMSGLRKVASFLIDWIRFGNPSQSPVEVRPRVVIVTSEDGASATHNVLEIDDLRFRLGQEDFGSRTAVFSSITLWHMKGEQVSPLARHRRLKELLCTEIDISRKARLENRLLFNAVHLGAFANLAVPHAAQSPNKPFDFIMASRLANNIDENYCKHLQTFFKMAEKYHTSYDSVASLVASSILMDAYPPRAHKFPPTALFKVLYSCHSMEALKEVFEDTELIKYLDRAISSQMEEMFAIVDLGFQTSAELHASNVRSSSAVWSQFKTNKTCLYCLRRKPEHLLTCEHGICDICMLLFGRSIAGQQGCYEVQRCILCISRGSAIARLKPATAGARVLTVDGGGVRGVVPLEYLLLLQNSLGPVIRLQDMIDVAFGTSSGALIVLGIFMKNWTVHESACAFEVLVRDFFGLQLTKGHGTLTRLRNYFRCWLSDGCYDVDTLESALKDVFGEDKRVFDVSTSSVIGTKVAVTATTISDASTYIFSNYNGCGQRSRHAGYKHVRADTLEKEPFLWEVGRATSAAPILFRSAHIQALGSFQDGGLKYNNPMDLAIWECQKIWALPVTPDLVLSLGTGKEVDTASPQAPAFRHVFNDGFLPRLFRSFMSSLDGERTWREALNRLDDERKTKYFRLNITLSGQGPRLDDVDQLDNLRHSVHAQDFTDLHGVIHALLASSFYFELGQEPTYEAGAYACRGWIRCRNDAKAILKVLYSKLALPEFTLCGDSLGRVVAEDICPSCQAYNKRTSFRVLQIEDTVNIYLQGRSISGFPNSVAWFRQRRALDWPFGTPDHDAFARLGCDVCNRIGAEPLAGATRKREIDQSPCGPGGRAEKKPRLQLQV